MNTPWFTAAELAGLAGMPGSEFRTRAKLDKLGVPSRLRGGSKGGGGREFDAAHLPAETRAALLLQHIEPADKPALPREPAPEVHATAVAHQPTGAVVPAPQGQRPPSRNDCACADARATIAQRLAEMAPLCGGITAAVRQLSHQLRGGFAAPELLAAARTANRRARQADTPEGVPLSERTLLGWHSAHTTGGWHALLPEPRAPRGADTVGDDVAIVLRRYASAVGSSRNLSDVAHAIGLELGLGHRERVALYHRARRALPKLDKVQLIKARHTSAERAAKLPYQRRLKHNLRPLDVGVCDGHSFKAKVRHPDHGQPFTPEVTVVMDVATRRITGWSVSLSESTIAVGDANRVSVERAGIYAVMYTDNGAGQKAKRFDCPVVGLFARLGTQHQTGRPNNPQGRGVIERSWQSHMLKCARQFATYSGDDADQGLYRNTALALAREQRAVKRAEAAGEVIRLSAKCPSWEQFLRAVADTVTEYNAQHRHRDLPKHEAGPAAGLHMTPDEAWAAMLVPADVQHLDAATLRGLFMPSTLATPKRGWIRHLNRHYFSHDLMQVDGERVRVDHDIHNAQAVWVWTVDGEYVCEAKLEGFSGDFFPGSVLEIARHKRVQAAIKRRQAQIDTAQRELQPTLPAPEAPAVYIGDLSAQPQELQMVERVDDTPSASAELRPFFDSPSERYEWLMQHRSRCTADESAWLAAYAQGPDYEGLRDYYASRGLEFTPDETRSFNQAV